MPVHDSDAALRALAHSGRRRVLEILAGGERTSGSLALECGWTKPAASQQLKVLREAGLIEVRTDGNRRLYRVRRQGLAELRAFLDDFWLAKLAALEDEIRRSRGSARPREPQGGPGGEWELARPREPKGGPGGEWGLAQ